MTWRVIRPLVIRVAPDPSECIIRVAHFALPPQARKGARQDFSLKYKCRAHGALCPAEPVAQRLVKRRRHVIAFPLLGPEARVVDDAGDALHLIMRGVRPNFALRLDFVVLLPVPWEEHPKTVFLFKKDSPGAPVLVRNDAHHAVSPVRAARAASIASAT